MDSCRVLLVEDNDSHAVLIQALLDRIPGRPFAFERSERLCHALERLASGGVQAILLDLALPDSFGLATLYRIQAAAPYLPVIVMTVSDDQELATLAMQAGAQDYLVKGQVETGLLARSIRYAIERKRSEQELLRLHRAVDASGEAIFTTGRDGTITSINPEFTRLYGYAPDEIIGQVTPRILKGGQVAPDSYAEFWNSLLARQFVRREFVNKTRDGRLIMVEASVSPIVDQDQITGFLAIHRDITERKRADSQLRESEARYRRLFQDAILGVFQSTLDGRFLSVNPACAQMFGYASPDELLAMAFDGGTDVYAEPGRREAILRTVIEKGSIRGYENLYRRRDTSLFSGNLHMWAVRDSDGTLLYLEGFVEDVTERKRAESQAGLQLERLAALHTIDTAITNSSDLSLTLTVILSQVTRCLDVNAADVLLFDGATQSLVHAAALGVGLESFKHLRVKLGQGTAGRAALERRPAQVADLGDLQDGRTDALRAQGFCAAFFIPLIAKGQLQGLLEIFHRQPLAPDSEWFDFLVTLAGQTAIAVDNATLFVGLQRSNFELALAYDTTLEGWSRALDLRDKETEGHTQRVTDLTLALARSVGIADAELVHIRRGALLHDIGKMAIPDEILLKPGPLTEGEWEIMRKHPAYAYELLSPISYLRPSLEIPYCHHEHWDGAGYPRGLSGDQIPLSARLFAVVDVWDALNSDRPYRPAWTRDQVRDHITSRAGRQFDPLAVDAFMKMLVDAV